MRFGGHKYAAFGVPITISCHPHAFARAACSPAMQETRMKCVAHTAFWCEPALNHHYLVQHVGHRVLGYSKVTQFNRYMRKFFLFHLDNKVFIGNAYLHQYMVEGKKLTIFINS